MTHWLPFVALALIVGLIGGVIWSMWRWERGGAE